MEKVRVGITQGDHNGIGLEVTLKALANETMLELCTPVLFADQRLVREALRRFGIENMAIEIIDDASDAAPGIVNVVDTHQPDVTLSGGESTGASGRGAVISLRKAMAALKNGETDVLVTAPICKETVQGDDFAFTGHTEWLGAEAGAGHDPQMILFDDNLRVALVTTHLPLSAIPGAITKEKVMAAVEAFSRTLKEDFGIVRPKVAVLSLNPHCGDGGLLGTEEAEIISPAIEECMEKGILAFGPYPADGFFGSGKHALFDGVLAMYHDQGLAPFKTMAGSRGVNFTGGLPWVRTSPDHGTACDIAWKGVADAASMREAIYKAVDLHRNRRTYQESISNPLQHQTAERPRKEPKPERHVKSAMPRRELSPEQNIIEKTDD